MKNSHWYWFICGALLTSIPAFGRMPYYLPWKSPTLREEISKAEVVLYGTFQNSRHCSDGGSRTDFVVSKVLKGDPKNLKEKQVHEIPTYVTVRDPDSPPRFIISAKLDKGKLDCVSGRPA